MGILENSISLREPPRETLARYLQQLNGVLEAIHSLDYRVFDGKLISDEEIPPFAAAARRARAAGV